VLEGNLREKGKEEGKKEISEGKLQKIRRNVTRKRHLSLRAVLKEHADI
jgi:hypothetical protein